MTLDQLTSRKALLEQELREIQKALDEKHEEELKREEIRQNYKKNEVPPKYRVNYVKTCEDLEALARAIVLADCSINEDDLNRSIEDIHKKNRTEIPPDPCLLYNCPACGKGMALYVGQFGTDWKDDFAVTCSYCDFTGPHTSDCGEAWYEFERYLKEEGYLKDNT